jgi:hypothetical protein
VNDTTELVDRITNKVESRTSGKVPIWAWRGGFAALGSLVLAAVGFGDYWRIKSITNSIENAVSHCDERMDKMSALFSARLDSNDSRMAEAERIRVEKIKQLEDVDRRTSITAARMDNLERGISDSIDQLRKSIDRIETKVDKLRGGQ